MFSQVWWKLMDGEMIDGKRTFEQADGCEAFAPMTADALPEEPARRENVLEFYQV